VRTYFERRVVPDVVILLSRPTEGHPPELFQWSIREMDCVMKFAGTITLDANCSAIPTTPVQRDDVPQAFPQRHFFTFDQTVGSPQARMA